MKQVSTLISLAVILIVMYIGISRFTTEPESKPPPNSNSEQFETSTPIKEPDSLSSDQEIGDLPTASEVALAFGINDEADLEVITLLDILQESH